MWFRQSLVNKTRFSPCTKRLDYDSSLNNIIVSISQRRNRVIHGVRNKNDSASHNLIFFKEGSKISMNYD